MLGPQTMSEVSIEYAPAGRDAGAKLLVIPSAPHLSSRALPIVIPSAARDLLFN
jgi:hypothetical protein